MRAECPSPEFARKIARKNEHAFAVYRPTEPNLAFDIHHLAASNMNRSANPSWYSKGKCAKLQICQSVDLPYFAPFGADKFEPAGNMLILLIFDPRSPISCSIIAFSM